MDWMSFITGFAIAGLGPVFLTALLEFKDWFMLYRMNPNNTRRQAASKAFKQIELF
jgi:hypothetical protein